MKKGDRVVCIIDGFFDLDTGFAYACDPIKGDELTIDGESMYLGLKVFSFKEIPELDVNGLRRFYAYEAFRKIDESGRNKLSQELAHKVTWEEMIRNPELQEKELNPRRFTTKEKF